MVTESVSETLSTLAESKAKGMIDDLVREIDKKIDTDGSRSQVETVDESPAEEDESDERDGYIIKLQNEGEALAIFSDSGQSDVMAEAVSYLIENYDLISEIEPLPYIPGRKKAIINDKPSSPHDEKAMRLPRELSCPYYLETHDNKEGKKRTVCDLTEQCGLEASFAGEW